MSENVWLFIIGLMASGTGALILLLLGIIVWELRQLRRELKEFVPDKMCRVMMAEHERDIREIRQVLTVRAPQENGEKNEISEGRKKMQIKKKKLKAIGIPVLAAAGLAAAAGCSSTCVVTEYDQQGKIVRKTERIDDLSKTVSDGLKNKSILIIRSGWEAKIRATPADPGSGGAANLEIGFGTRHSAYSGIPAGAVGAQEIANAHKNAIISVLKTRISVDDEGVSGSSGAGTQSSGAD